MKVLQFYPDRKTFIICMICFLTLFFSLPVFSQDPIADFTTDQTSGCSGMVVIFTDQSKNADSWSWSFPGGNPSSASTQGPHQVTYSNIGSFDVSLEVEGNNSSDKKYKTGYITVNDCSPSANFSVSPSSGCSPLTVTYTDQSADADTWSWSFPGGNPSGAQTKGPHTVTYSSAGSYHATLVVANQYGQDTKIKNHVVNVSRCLDFGDAPAPYPTTMQQNGARHTYDATLFLGQVVDREADGQPDSTATGDDNNGQNDEDGVELLQELVPGDTTRISVTASSGGYLKAWIDFNRDGDWEDEGEEVLDEQVGAGANELEIFVPEDAVEGNTYARFRYSGNIIPSYDGEVNGGEVEDFRFYLENFHFYDYGDAPDDETYHYRTLREHNGARHPVDPTVFLGGFDGYDVYIPPDKEGNGHPNDRATGDDVTDIDDERGIRIAMMLSPGHTALIKADLRGNGTLHAWFDWNRDGDWSDAGEYALTYDNTEGDVYKYLSVDVPAWVSHGIIFARYRYTVDPVSSWYGRGGKGEVEDHERFVYDDYYDYGDAPESYGTLAPGGARHPMHFGIILGEQSQIDNNGHPSEDALGDDHYLMDDEDGLISYSVNPGEGGTFGLTFSADLDHYVPYLHAWIDFNKDGDFLDEGEKVIGQSDGIWSGSTVQTFNFDVPADAHVGLTYARFRFTTDPDPGPSGPSDYPGEVEDYRIRVGDLVFDYGDAMFPYPTTMQQNGARHIIDPDVYLGLGVSADEDGQPDSLAMGDDDDGVELIGAMVIGDTSLIQITASTNGFLKAWIDFNRDGDWEDETEEVCDAQIDEGLNELQIYIPDDAAEGPTYGRFRFSSDDIPSFDGEIFSGEVEDMRFYMERRFPYDYGDAPDNDTLHYETLYVNDGARHPVDGSTYLANGIVPTVEFDGQPGPTADNDGGYREENGIWFYSVLSPGKTTPIQIFMMGAAYLHGWIDFNRDGDFHDSGEYFLQFDNNVPPHYDDKIFHIATPETAVPGLTYARFRYSSDPIPFTPGGLGGNGEVEDYALYIYEHWYDYGDAPECYNTTGDDAARHPVNLSVRLGIHCDSEPNGQPSSIADGDDRDVYENDEDGVEFDDLIPGETTEITIRTCGSGYLYAWIDFNSDGDWEDAGENVISGIRKNHETTVETVDVPADAVLGYTFARFRYVLAYEDSPPAVNSYGESLPGEVEDYRIPIGIIPYDFGDAPDDADFRYETLLASDGARHIADPSLYLGYGSIDHTTPDTELDGIPSPDAQGDDNDGADDEDGVYFHSYLAPGEPTVFQIHMTGAGYLHGWADFNRDGDFHDSGEYFLTFDNTTLPESDREWFDVLTPETAVAGRTYVRFRYSSDPAPFTPGGLGGIGDVEDYAMDIVPYYYDYGDAPECYHTTDDDAARHPLDFVLMLGDTCDLDMTGMPSMNADGDDIDGDDEDGVVFAGLVPDDVATITVRARYYGWLYAWIDFNQDGDWEDTGENIISGDPIVDLTTEFRVDIPADAVPGGTYARFRYIRRYAYDATAPVLNSYGTGRPGEVEDYRIIIAGSKSDVKTDHSQVIPEEYALNQNCPNPFNNETSISYALCKQSHTRLVILNANGQILRTLVNKVEPAGIYTVHWNGLDNHNIPVGSGVYIVRIHAGSFRMTRKIIMMK